MLDEAKTDMVAVTDESRRSCCTSGTTEAGNHHTWWHASVVSLLEGGSFTNANNLGSSTINGMCRFASILLVIETVSDCEHICNVYSCDCAAFL